MLQQQMYIYLERSDTFHLDFKITQFMSKTNMHGLLGEFAASEVFLTVL